MVGPIHHLHRYRSPPFQAEIMGHVVAGGQEDGLLCQSSADRITHCNRIGALRKYLGKSKVAAGVGLYCHVGQSAIGGDFHARSGRSHAIRQENVTGENSGDGVD